MQRAVSVIIIEKNFYVRIFFFAHFWVDVDFSGSGRGPGALASPEAARKHLILLISERMLNFSSAVCQAAEISSDEVSPYDGRISVFGHGADP